jgi:hypothetical protein
MSIENNKMQEEDGLELIRKVVNLSSEQRKLVNKLVDASDQCKDIIDVILSSPNPMLDLVQKILRSNTEELNLLRKVTELNYNDWEQARKFICLCSRKKYFICRFMDWYLKDQSFDLPCSCPSLKEVDTGEYRTSNIKKYGNHVGNSRTMNSSYTSQQCKSNEKDVTCGTNQGASRELNKSFSEKLFPVTESCTGNRNLSERCGSSLECRIEKEAEPMQPAMTEQKLMCHEHLISHCSRPHKDYYVKPVSQVEHNDRGFQRKGTKQLDDKRVEGSCTSAINTLCSTSVMQNRRTVHKEMLLNENSVLPVNENMEGEQEQSLLVCTQCTDCTRRTEESLKELPNFSTKQGMNIVLTTANMDKEVNEPEMYFCLPEVTSESLRRNEVDVNDSPLSAVNSPGIPLQNRLEDECLFQAEGRIEIQDDISEKESNNTVCSKGRENGNCVLVAGENLSTLLGDEVQKVHSALSGKEDMEIISDTHDSVLMARRITKPLPENKCCVQPEIEIETSGSNLNGQEFILESTLEKSKGAVLDNSKERNVPFSPGNANKKNENLITITRDVIKSGDVHLPGKEIKNMSDTHDSLLTVKECTNSSVMSSSVQLNVNNRHEKLNGSGQKAALCNVTDKETLIIPDNTKVNSENLMKLLEDKPENVIAHLSRKESEKMITETHHPLLQMKSTANSGSKEGRLSQKEVESEDAESSDHRQEPIPPQKKFRKDETRSLKDSVVKEVLLPPKNLKVNSEQLNTISRDKTEKVDTHLTGMENKLSDQYDSFSARKQNTNSVSKNCYVQLEIGNKDAKSNCNGQEPSHQSNFEGTERAVLDISTKKGIPVPPKNMKVKSEVARKISKGNKLITDTRPSLLAVRSITDSKSDKICVYQKEIESKNAKSRAHVEKKTPLLLKSIKMSQTLRKLSREELEEAAGYMLRKKKKKRASNFAYFLRERKNTNSLLETTCVVQPETESKCAQSNDSGKESVPSQLKLKDTKIVVFDKKTESYQQIKSKGIDPSVVQEKKCEGECSVVADHSASKEASILPPGSKKTIQLTEEVMYILRSSSSRRN